MLKQLVNECVIDLHIAPDGPILIRSGVANLTGPDMAFVRTWWNNQPEVYLPGSSLKGVLRSHAERIARTLRPTQSHEPALVCDPFASSGEAAFCGHVFERRKDKGEIDPKGRAAETNEIVYRDSCPICRLFGSTWFAGRLATADAYVVEPPKPQQRDGVGIDRFTGGAARAVKFELEVVTGGRFATTFHLRNFELWQLGLVGFLLQDLKEGLIRIGAGKSRGLGKVRGEVQSVKLYYLGRDWPRPENGQLPLRGVGDLVPDNEMARAYGMVRPDVVFIPYSGETPPPGVRATYTFPRDSFPWEQVAPCWVRYASEEAPIPPSMSAYRRRSG